MSKLESSVGVLARVMYGGLSGGAAESMYVLTCAEADALVMVLAVGGHERTAVVTLMGHILGSVERRECSCVQPGHEAVFAASDDETPLDGDGFPNELATEYVRQLAA